MLFVVVLVGSLATNAYLLLAGTRHNTPPPAKSPLVAAAPRRPRPVPTPVTHAGRVPDSISKLDRAVLEERLQNAEAKVDALRPLYEKFDLASGGAEDESRVRTVIDRVFGVEGSGQRPYDLECRGDICRFQTDVRPAEWQEAFQFEMLGLARDMSFSSDAVYFHVEAPGEAASKQYVIRVASSLSMSPALGACKRGQSATGTVNITLRLVDRHVEVDTSGPLAGAAPGLCIRRVAEDVVRATPLPDEVTELPMNTWPVTLP